ncbi:unnamed protein product [Gongylonema pulchrum]|uniref:CC domain-containing protein n=1 Tax=Gongylonema pulchrum TaxID=637853 RepID=A0A183EBL7_9BILA|nr:unnamed protein product [Gongylonema pulchrum]
MWRRSTAPSVVHAKCPPIVALVTTVQAISEINPGESGCTQNRQCEAVWPGAYCRSGECRCANNQPPFRTRDGLVCLNYGFCPLNGNNPKFRIENQVQQCYGGSDATCEAIGALAYDCICDKEDCTVNNPISFCCPSRGCCLFDCHKATELVDN